MSLFSSELEQAELALQSLEARLARARHDNADFVRTTVTPRLPLFEATLKDLVDLTQDVCSAPPDSGAKELEEAKGESLQGALAKLRADQAEAEDCVRSVSQSLSQLKLLDEEVQQAIQRSSQAHWVISSGLSSEPVDHEGAERPVEAVEETSIGQLMRLMTRAREPERSGREKSGHRLCIDHKSKCMLIDVGDRRGERLARVEYLPAQEKFLAGKDCNELTNKAVLQFNLHRDFGQLYEDLSDVLAGEQRKSDLS